MSNKPFPNGYDIIVLNKNYTQFGAKIQNSLGSMDKAIKIYNNILNKVLTESIIEGKVSAQLRTILAYSKIIEGEMEWAGEKYELLCEKFQETIDNADQKLYNLQCEVDKRFTESEYNKLLKMTNTPCKFFDKLRELQRKFKDFVVDLELSGISATSFSSSDVTDKRRDYVLNRIVDYNDYSQNVIYDIFMAVCSVDNDFFNLFQKLNEHILSIEDDIRILSDIMHPSASNLFSEAKMAELRAKVLHTRETHVAVEYETKKCEESTLKSADAFIKFFYDNALFLEIDEYLVNLNKELDFGILDTAAIIWGSKEDVVAAYTQMIPADVPYNKGYQYLQVKKSLAEQIKTLSENDLEFLADSDEYEYYKRIVEDFLNTKDHISYNSLVSDEMRELLEAFYEPIEKYLSVIPEQLIKVVDILTIILGKYEKNIEVISSLANGVDSNSITGIAVRELINEYKYPFIASIEQFINELLSGIFKKTKKDLIKNGIELICSYANSKATGLYGIVSEASEAVMNLSGLEESSSAQFELCCLYDTIAQTKDAFTANAEILKNAEEITDAMRLNVKNSFELLKEMYSKAYEYASEIANGKSDYDKSAYYLYMQNRIASWKLNDTDISDFQFISFDEYMSTHS